MLIREDFRKKPADGGASLTTVVTKAAVREIEFQVARLTPAYSYSRLPSINLPPFLLPSPFHPRLRTSSSQTKSGERYGRLIWNYTGAFEITKRFVCLLLLLLLLRASKQFCGFRRNSTRWPLCRPSRSFTSRGPFSRRPSILRSLTTGSAAVISRITKLRKQRR